MRKSLDSIDNPNAVPDEQIFERSSCQVVYHSILGLLVSNQPDDS